MARETYLMSRTVAPAVVETWTLFNECLQQGRIPDRWRDATLKQLYKGKGDSSDPDAYRSIALEYTLLKVLTNLLTGKLENLVGHHIPEEQFGSRKNGSTLHAIECFQKDIEEATKPHRGKLITVFIDNPKAFDTVNRQKLIDKLATLTGEENPITQIAKDTLAENRIQIDNSISISMGIEKMASYKGISISPNLFNIVTYNVAHAVKTEGVNVYV